MLRFSETIRIIIGNPYVRPPERILKAIFKQAGKSTSPIPVRGTINGAPFQQSLVRYQGDWRLYVNIIMAKAGKMPFKKSIAEIVGRKAAFELEFDTEPRSYGMVSFLQRALAKDESAHAAWKKLPPSRQKEVLRYFSGLKSDEAKRRNLDKLIQALTAPETRFMARTWKDGK
jgi:hypothetical protein